MAKKKKAKETSAKLSSLAARILNGYEPTREEIVSMAASLMSQDQTKGQNIETGG